MENVIKLNDSFSLVKRTIQKDSPVQTITPPTNHIFVVDVSGSMSYDLADIRKQLKNKLSDIMKDGDTISIIWFSGRGQSGVLKEEVEVKSLKSLQDLHSAIDKFLKPIGLTAFHPPLVLAKEVIGRIKQNRPNSVFSLIFLTDGYNNDSSWSDVTKTLKELDGEFAASTFVEYGYYADSKRISEMAELLGGEKVEAAGFSEYEPIFENKIQKNYSSAKRIEIEFKNKSSKDFAFTVTNDGEILVYPVNDNKVLVPEYLSDVYYFTADKVLSSATDIEYNDFVKALYASVYVLTDKFLIADAEDVYSVLGDISTYNLFVNAFGKQKLNEFKQRIKSCVVNVEERFKDGKSSNLVVDENAYCVMNLLADLGSDKRNMFLPFDKSFNYKKVSAGKSYDIPFSDDDRVKIAAAKSIKELEEITHELVSKYEASKASFKYDDLSAGISFTDLVWNEDRANVSVRGRFTGVVTLPPNKFGLESINSYVYRTYTIIKDGIINIESLPVKLTEDTYILLYSKGLISDYFYDENIVYQLNLTKIPVVNRKIVREVSAYELAKLEIELLKFKGLNKVLGYYEDLYFPKKSEEFVSKYSEEAEAWLKEIGVTSYNGFNPPSVVEHSGDVYMSVNLETKITGCSTLPKVTDVIKKYEANPNADFKITEKLMVPFIQQLTQIQKSDLYQHHEKSGTHLQLIEKWLKDSKYSTNEKKREIITQVAQIKYGLILSKRWFKEFTSFDENTVTIADPELGNVVVKFDLSDKEVKL